VEDDYALTVIFIYSYMVEKQICKLCISQKW